MKVGDLIQEVINYEGGGAPDRGRVGIVREVDPIDKAFCAIWVSWVGGGWQELDWDCLYSPDFIILSKVAK
tara:strand:+ start:795 stop:1007 length:213 start_codon:yes stop_codon:yes gene_type:complete